MTFTMLMMMLIIRITVIIIMAGTIMIVVGKEVSK